MNFELIARLRRAVAELMRRLRLSSGLPAAAAPPNIVVQWLRRRHLIAPAPYPWWGLNELSYASETNLALGALFDLLLAYVLVLAIAIAAHKHPPMSVQVVLTLIIAAAKYAWSTDLFRNKVPTFFKGGMAFLEKIVPSGPDGKGLPPGYYWTILGRPFYTLVLVQSVKELTVEFKNMQVWAANSSTRGQGAIQGETDGVAQFEIIDPGAWNAVEHPLDVLTAIVYECARDVCESMTIEGFIATSNNELADKILVLTQEKLVNRIKSLGVRCISVNVKKTDNKDQDVKNGWAQVNVQGSLATARGVDAMGRAARIRLYRRQGVDANRAAVLDAVTSDKAGATVTDGRNTVDIGPAIQAVGNAFADKIGGRS